MNVKLKKLNLKDRENVDLKNKGNNANTLLSVVSRPIVKMKLQWYGFDCIIQKLRYRDMVAKLKPDYSGKPMPYDYFWVDFNEIGF